jgi:RNA polymerase primary sigma factor
VYKAPASFSQPVGSPDENGDTLGDTISDDSERSPEELAMRKNLQIDLDNVLATLTQREAGILRSRYGLDDGRQRTLEEVGLQFDVRARLCTSLAQPLLSSLI